MDTYQRRPCWPTVDWEEASLQAVGMDSTKLAQMQDYIGEHLPGLHSLLIVRHGYLVFEEYFQCFHKKSYHNMASVTKSIISALVSIALTQGKLKSLDQPMLDFFPDYAFHSPDLYKQAVTLRHLLSLTGGFWQGFTEEYWHNVYLCDSLIRSCSCHNRLRTGGTKASWDEQSYSRSCATIYSSSHY